MDLTREQVTEWLGNRTPLEMADIIRELEGKWGVKAAPVAVQQQGFAPPPPPNEEQTEFSVILASAGTKKIDVIKVVREITGLGLKEAKDLVESAPKTLKESTSKADAEEMRTKLVAAGATVELK